MSNEHLWKSHFIWRKMGFIVCTFFYLSQKRKMSVLVRTVYRGGSNEQQQFMFGAKNKHMIINYRLTNVIPALLHYIIKVN